MTTFGLTPRQAMLLRYIRDYAADHNGASPSFDEMAKAVGFKSKGHLHRLIKGLEARGRIRRLPRQARSIEIIEGAP